MKIIFVLIILAIILLSVAITVFFWAIRKRQFDDLEVQAFNILKEDNYEQNQDATLNDTKPNKSNHDSVVEPKKSQHECINQTSGKNK